MVSRPQRRHARPHLCDNSGTFMAKDRRKNPFWICPRQRVRIGVTDARRLHLDEHLTGTGSLELYCLDGQRFTGFVCDCGANLHGIPPKERRYACRNSISTGNPAGTGWRAFVRSATLSTCVGSSQSLRFCWLMR